MNIWVIILGIVQGITEFLPISSTAHLILIPYLVKIPDFGLSFDVGLHLGTFWAVLIYFLKDWWEFLVSIFKGGEKRRILGLIVLATLPAGILGVFLDPFVEKISQPQVYSFAIWIILIGVISFGIIFLLLEKYSKKNLEIKDLNLKRGLIIGFWQVLSLFPGVSRSGSTISGGMFTGLKRDEATKFSFYLSLPIIGGAVFFKLFHVIKSGDLGSLSLILWGAIVAFIVKKASLKVFSYYRFILALAILLAYFNLQVLSLIVFGVAIVYLIFRMVRGEKERN